MKVLIISHMYPSVANEIYGIFVQYQVKALVKKGVDITVVSPVPWSPFPIHYLAKKWSLYHKIPYHTFCDRINVYHPRYLVFPHRWLFWSAGWRMYLGIRKLIARLSVEWPFDLIHAHVALPDGYAGALLAQEFRKPLIITIHGQDIQQVIGLSYPCAKAVEYSINASSQVILVSKKLQKIALNYFNGQESKLTVISNGINSSEIYSRDSQDFTPREFKVVLSVSNLVKTKGIDLNLYAIKKLVLQYNCLRYIIVGDGSERVELARLVSQLDLEKHVIFLGQQSHAEVMRLMASCDIFSLPSWNEGFGIVYIEAMAHGKPVIGCQGEGIEDVIENGKTGLLVEPKSVDSLVKSLDFLLSHPKESQTMGELARQIVLANYTWDVNAQKTIKLYQQLVSNSNFKRF